MQDHTKLRVWNEAHQLALDVRQKANRFPDGFASLKSQLIRASESIGINIAEGCGSATQKEFARFLDISIKSTSETQDELQLAKDNQILREADWVVLQDAVVRIRKMLFRLRQRVLDPTRTSSNR